MKSNEDHGWNCPACHRFRHYGTELRGTAWLNRFTLEAANEIINHICCYVAYKAYLESHMDNNDGRRNN